MRMVSAAGSFAPHVLCAVSICQLSSFLYRILAAAGMQEPAIALLLLLRNAGVIGSQERPAELI